MNPTIMHTCSVDPKTVIPNEDISGPGVLVGFLGTAYFIVVVIIGYYLLSFDPEQNPFQRRSDIKETRNTWKPNPIDQQFLRFIRSYVSRLEGRTATAESIRWHMEVEFEQCILRFCDLQIITGILISGFMCLQEGISAYHWQILVYLAWFSNITHLSTLTFLRGHLYSRKDLRERNVRIFFMIALLIVLLVAKVPTGFFNWMNVPEQRSAANATSYAACFFDMKQAKHRFDMDNIEHLDARIENTTAIQIMLVSVFLMCFNFATRVVKLSETLSSFFNNNIRSMLSRWCKSIIARHVYCNTKPVPTNWARNRNTYLITKPLMALFLLGRLYSDLYTSTPAEVYWLLISTIWGSIQLFAVKGSVHVEDGKITFGQILPIILLVAPLFPMVLAVVQSIREIPSTSLESQNDLREQATLDDTDNGITMHSQGQPSDSKPKWLSQDYYSASWMKPTIVLAMFQVLFLTGSVLALMSVNVNFIQTLLTNVCWFFVVQPASCYFVVLFGIAMEGHCSTTRLRKRLPTRRLSILYWTVATIILLLYPLSPMWFGSPTISEHTVGIYLVFLNIHLPVAIGILAFYVLVCTLFIRSSSSEDEEKVETHDC